MFESIIRESPVLYGTIAAVVAAFIFLVVSALFSSWRSRRKTAPVRREPVFDRRRVASVEASRPHAGPHAHEPEGEPRRGFGFGALAASFVVGLAAGAGGLAISSTGQFGSVVQALVGLVESEPPNSGDASGLDILGGPAAHAAPAAAAPLPERSSGGTTADANVDDVKARLAVFAGNLKSSLPKDAGPEIALTTVDTSDMTLSLGYSVGRTMADDEIPQFNAYIMRTIKSLLCGKEAREIRFLNDNGVAFYMEYTDPRGATVAKLAVPPGFCA